MDEGRSEASARQNRGFPSKSRLAITKDSLHCQQICLHSTPPRHQTPRFTCTGLHGEPLVDDRKQHCSGHSTVSVLACPHSRPSRLHLCTSATSSTAENLPALGPEARRVLDHLGKTRRISRRFENQTHIRLDAALRIMFRSHSNRARAGRKA